MPTNTTVLENPNQVSPFTDVNLVDLPIAEDSRFGLDQFRNVMELQVGMANGEFNPKILRVDRSGMWLGQQRFVNIPTDSIVPNTKPVKFQVDMLGNITATSYKTAADGQRVEIIDNEIAIYDSNGIARIVIGDSLVGFFDQTGAPQGQVTGIDAPFPTLLVEGVHFLALATQHTNHLVFDDITPAGFWVTLMVFANLSTDPTPVNGGMYYNTGSDTFRRCQANVWSDIP